MITDYVLGQSHHDPDQWILSDAASGATLAIFYDEAVARRLFSLLVGNRGAA